MARKLNRKFVIIVGGVTLAAVLGVGGLAVWRMQTGPERNIAMGDAALKSGRFNEAVERYGRAANRRPDRTEYWRKYVSALEQQPTNTTQSGTQNFFQLLAGRAKLAESDPTDVEALTEYLKQLSATNPADVALACTRIAPIYAKHPKQTAIIEVASLSAALRQWESKRAGIDDAERKLLDLARAPESGTEPWLGLVEYANARLEVAQRAGISADTRRWSELLDGYLSQAIAAHPRSPRLHMALVIKFLGSDRDQRRTVDQAQAPAAFNELLTIVTPQVQSLESMDVTNLLRIGRNLGPVQRDQSIELAQDWLDQHPSEPLVMAELASLLQESDRQADRDESIVLSAHIRDMQTFPSGQAALTQDSLRVRAAQSVFDTQFLGLLEAPDQADRDAMMPSLEQALQAMRRVAGAGNEQLIGRCEAFLQFARGQYAPALRGLERIVSAPDADTLSMIVAIDSAVRREEFGVAQQLAARAAARYPQNPRVVEGALRVSQTTGRRDEALALAERLQSIEPDNALANSILAAAKDPARMAPAKDELEAQLRKAFQDAKGNPIALRDAAVPLMTANPTDVRPRLMWVEAIMRVGDREAAMKAIDESLALFPDNDLLKARKLDLSTLDPVERARMMAAQRGGSDSERLLYEIFTLLAGEPAFERAVLDSSDPVDRERITKELASIRKGIDETLPKALAANRGNETLLILLAERGARRKDPALVDQAVKAAASSSDPKLPNLIKAIAALRGGDATQAIELLRADADAGTADAIRLRALGEAYLAVGAPDKAVDVLARAFERQPTNSGIGRIYADALLAVGDSRKALTLLGDAAAANPADGALFNQWLNAESRFGDRARALVERRRRLSQAPDDLTNVRALAALLLEIAPDPTTILDDQLRPRYSLGQWEAMRVSNREDAVRRARESNVAEAKGFLSAIRAADPNDLDALNVEMLGLTALGDVDGAEAALRGAEASVTRGRPMLFLMQADFYYRISKPEQAEQALLRALESAPGDAITIRAVARVRAGRGELEAALKTVEPLLAAQPSNNDLREAARWNLSIRKPDAAKALLARVQDGTDRREQFATRLVQSLVFLQEVIAKQEAGDRAGMDASFAESRMRLDEAAKLDPRSSVPAMSLGEMSMQMFRRTGDKSYLDICLSALESAQQLDQLSVPIARLRWTALEAKGDRADAASEAKRILAVLPKEGSVRMELVDLLLRAGDQAGARVVLEEAVQQSALNAVWLRRLAQIQSESRQFAEAGQSYERAFASDRSIGSLELAARAYLSKDPPDLRNLSMLIRAYPEQVRTSMYLQSARSAGECLSGARDAGLANLRSIYQANLAAGAARQPVQGWFDILLDIFKVKQSKSELEAYDAFVRQVADMKDPESLRQLASAWTLLYNAPPEVLAKARDYAQQALAAAGTDPLALAMSHMSLGNVLYRMGDCANASKEFETVLESYPNQFESLNNAAYIEATCGDPQKALGFARRAAAINPLNVDGIDTLGLAQLKTGDPVAAEATLLRGLEIRQTPTMLLHLAMVQDALGRKDAARSSLANAMVLAKDTPFPESEAAIAARLEASLK